MEIRDLPNVTVAFGRCSYRSESDGKIPLRLELNGIFVGS